MADNTDRSAKTPGGFDLLGLVYRNPKQTAQVLIGLGILCALIPVWMGYKYRWEYLAVCLWGGALAVTFLVAGGQVLLRLQEKPHTLDDARMLILAVGGLAGLATTLMGVALTFKWSGAFSALAGGGAGASVLWRVFAILVGLIGGTAIMFASLLLGRTEVRSNPSLRRMLFGYNVVLSGLLLFAILVIINVVIYVRYPGSIDFTSQQMFTLSDRSKSILAGLKEPTKVYALLTRRNPFYDEIKTLLTNSRDVNPNIRVEELSPDLDAEQVQELGDKYGITEREGLLLLYGNEPDVQHRFVKLTDMVPEEDRFRPRSSTRELPFKGEDALISELSFMTEGQKKPVIYFTQGHGELDLNNSDLASRVDPGAGIFKSRLEKRNFEVKPLKFTLVDPKVPDDAEVVVIARPREVFDSSSLKALQDYMNPASAAKRKGRLLALMSIEGNPDNTVRKTNLEEFLGGFGVQLGDERLLSLEKGSFVRVLFGANQVRAKNPIALAFARSDFWFRQPRAVRPSGSNPPGLTAQSLLWAPDEQYILPERNLTTGATQLLLTFRKSLQENPKEAAKRLSPEPISVAVLVTESASLNPNDPHASLRPTEQAPRLAVYGDGTLAANELAQENYPLPNFELLASTIEWLRDRQTHIGIPPRTRTTFMLEGKNVHYDRMVLLPGLLMFVGIAGLGTGVWLVRRK